MRGDRRVQLALLKEPAWIGHDAANRRAFVEIATRLWGRAPLSTRDALRASGGGGAPRFRAVGYGWLFSVVIAIKGHARTMHPHGVAPAGMRRALEAFRDEVCVEGRDVPARGAAGAAREEGCACGAARCTSERGGGAP